ncbi:MULTISPECIES: response regulator transcription factor [Christiangramia]|jgi:DNA-binding response OmpR family regulator|uniref:Two-component system response regulator n=2 Tax=Christiangramia forsetii TaxID=411153 RepID=A0M0Q4_CHRFK|nr:MULTISPECIES: response regulator transcription factor [Christiangramia]WPY97344.1 response regulator transcription factor [Christiangramia sp. OXR-203]GGG40332.1 DNA-binding response regulator [Christiangramia forsetii]CAL66199.1 two-component system response regulator [Christiangramia forsetii KT0803]|tara:strand:+ start:302 stop:976 length:675 start_codon:yes stop_codon:yes gene_type:complete
MKYLIAEDEKELQQSIATYLSHEANVCETASDYHEASEKLELYEYDIVILDINLVTGSGLDLLKKLKKQQKKCGVIIISANSSLDNKLEGLDLGADDYITKPFHLAELNSRIKAVLRRGQFGGDNTINFQEIKLDTMARSAYVNGKAITLTRKEYDLLLFFITNQGRVLSKAIIAEHLWGDDSDLLDNFDFIYVHINNLRKKLTKEGAKYIQTAYGSGYKFIAD